VEPARSLLGLDGGREVQDSGPDWHGDHHQKARATRHTTDKEQIRHLPQDSPSPGISAGEYLASEGRKRHNHAARAIEYCANTGDLLKCYPFLVLNSPL